VSVAADLDRALNLPGDALAPAAMAIARLEYPRLEPAPYLERIEALGREAARRVSRGGPGATLEARVAAVSRFLYDEQGFSGNREHYDDPRNSLLNEVMERRTGIPITLAVVYLEVARRAGLRVAGINFPGHFLLRASEGGAGDSADFVIIDPFHGGALLSEADCRELLRQHLGEEAAFDRTLLEPATRHHIIVRMLVNLKRLYVRMRSFPQARFISDLLLAVDPSATSELRDRGLLAYHLQDFAAALRDLEEYLRLAPRIDRRGEPDAEEGDIDSELWEHVKNLRKRVAGFN
jgi:regulator of sirC expression with transglutaminase-like and TPR domain